MKKFLFYISQNYSFAILRPIQKIIINRGNETRWFCEGYSVNEDYLAKDEIKLDTIDQVKAYQPDVVIAPANSIPTFMPGLKVAVFHGFDPGKLDRRGRNDHFKVRGCFDLYCTQGPNTTRPFETRQKKYGYFNVIETGWPALDPLFENPQVKNRSARPIILLCSTFSKRLSCAKYIYQAIKEISRSGRWQWVVQFHPKMDPEITSLYKAIQNEHLSFIETDNVIPLLQQADVMVSDTSSVIPMFLVQNKPVVTFKNINPGPYLLDINDPVYLEQTIEKALDRPALLMQEIQIFINQTHPYTDGKSSQRVVNAIDDVMGGMFPLSKSKPLNMLKNLKFRKRLNYWKF
jgi:CDP-glycerol glycerophosphotransferase (TagB/SpsB family)